jgi:hypothetical protein
MFINLTDEMIKNSCKVNHALGKILIYKYGFPTLYIDKDWIYFTKTKLIENTIENLSKQYFKNLRN